MGELPKTIALPLSTTGIPFVNANGVAVRIKDHRHTANRRCQWLDAEFHLVIL